MTLCQPNSQKACEMNTKANRPDAAQGKVSKMAASITRNNTNTALGSPQNGNMSPLPLCSSKSERREENIYAITSWKGTLLNM